MACRSQHRSFLVLLDDTRTSACFCEPHRPVNILCQAWNDRGSLRDSSCNYCPCVILQLAFTLIESTSKRGQLSVCHERFIDDVTLLRIIACLFAETFVARVQQRNEQIFHQKSLIARELIQVALLFDGFGLVFVSAWSYKPENSRFIWLCNNLKARIGQGG